MAIALRKNKLRFVPRHVVVPPPPPPGGAARTGYEWFFDDFDYVVNRDDPGSLTDNPFTTRPGAPWDACKSLQFGETGAKGYLYTTTEIEGFPGIAPSVSGSGRVLCAEFLGASLGQTDCYLQIGSESGGVNFLPADIWIQFWVYFQNYGSQAGDANDMKFLYPSQTVYPRPANEMWLSVFKSNCLVPYSASAPPGSNGFFIVEHPELANWTGAPSWDAFKLSHTDANPPTPITENGWRLVRMHYDMSGVTVPGGIAEGWVRDYGSATFLKYMEWIHGAIVAGSQFNWPLPNNDGAKMLRLFTTTEGDFFLYMSDFAIAAGVNSGGNGVDDLPVYTQY